MANSRSKQVVAGIAAIHPTDASALVQVVGEYVTKTGDVIGDIVEMGAFPRNCVLVDVVVDNGALGASATLDVGVMSGEYGDAVLGRTMGAEFVQTAAAATAGVIRRNRVASGVASSNLDRSWGIKFQGANPAASQTIRAVALFAPKLPGVA